VPAAIPHGAARRPAHREAFVRLRKEQTGPLVGAAYEKVERWIGAQGLRIAGPPREVFYTDYFDAADADDMFDVAFPLA
jgi:effector-binding domain-containing protein